MLSGSRRNYLQNDPEEMSYSLYFKPMKNSYESKLSLKFQFQLSSYPRKGRYVKFKRPKQENKKLPMSTKKKIFYVIELQM